MKYLYVFAAMCLVDYCWAQYIQATAKRRAIPASLYSAVLVLISAFVTVAYVENPRMILPAMAGAFVGTWVSVHYGE